MPLWAQYAALGVGVALLVFDVVILQLSFQERRERRGYISATNTVVKRVALEAEERSRHIEAIEAASELLNRTEYEQLIIDQVAHADERILCFWYSLHAEEHDESYTKINCLLDAADDRGVVVRVVTSQQTPRIYPAFQLVERGVELRFQETLLGDDLRFMLADRDMSVLGLPASNGPDERQSVHGVGVPGRKLSSLLFGYFESQWSDAAEYEEYVGRLVRRGIDDDETRAELVATELQLPVQEVRRLAAATGSGGAA